MKFVIAGGSGFVGRAVVGELTATFPEAEVVVLTRTERAPSPALPRVAYAVWDPAEGRLSPAVTEGAQAVFNLAGETAVGRRQTEKVEAEIRESRLKATRTLVHTFGMNSRPPARFISASAVGYYGGRAPEEVLDEASPPGNDFLAEVCVAWEKEAIRAESDATRVVRARLGIVLGRDGGALEAMARPFRAFVGGRIGSGKQIVSWIHLTDAARAFVELARDERFQGPVNLTAPEPASNQALSLAIAKTLGRPSLLPVPEFALRAAFGRGAEPLLTGQRVLPQVLLAAGFQFRYPRLEKALAEALIP